MIISNLAMLEAAIIISRGCKERQSCYDCNLSNICKKDNRSRPPEDWEKLLARYKINRKGGDHTRKEEL